MAGAVSSALLARTATQVQSLVLVLFVLARFHSAPLAGLAVMAAIVPGLLFSPVAGALLDRAGRVPLIALDYLVGALAYGLLSALALAHLLARWDLLVIVGAAAVTYPLSNTGTRSLFPLVVPRPLWDRANAVDSGGFVVATVLGPALAGGAVALVGPAASLALPSLLLVGAAACLVRVRVPPPAVTPRVTDPAWLGRAFAVSMSLNYLGVPLGAAAAGPLFDRGLTVGFLAAGAVVAASAVLPFVLE